MEVINLEVTNVDNMLVMYERVLFGTEISPRGQKCRNVRNLAIVLRSDQNVVTSFSARNFNLDYAKKEWLWYLGADRFDTSIEQHATMWAKIKQPDGSYFSNYGQYLFDGPFGSPVMDLVHQLGTDPDSRRASIPLLKAEHMFRSNTDVVCTYAINFAIEGSALHMTVMMRSNDVVFGFTNDAFCFWQLHRLVHALLIGQYPDVLGGLKLGTYAHFTNSMHVYERHFDMLAKICADGFRGYTHIEIPPISPHEATVLMMSNGKRSGGPYGDWLHS